MMPTMWSRRDLKWKDDRLMLGTRNTGAKVIADSKWPNMYRVEFPPGVISDMTNYSRARDAAMELVIHHMNRPMPNPATMEAATEPLGVVIPSSGVQYLPQATELTYASSAL
jgi:hypothetical protein